jgi:hypothetical protein
MNTDSKGPYAPMPEKIVPEHRQAIKFNHFEAKKGYKWAILALIAGMLFGLQPVILGKSSYYGVSARIMFGCGGLIFSICYFLFQAGWN